MKFLTILTIFLLIIPITLAQDMQTSRVSIDDSVNWLMMQSQTNAFNAALTTLAATKSDIVDNQEAAKKLLALKHKTQACWPSANCNVKDTAVAIAALTRTGNKIPTTWLEGRESASTEGTWYLQIDTQAEGECDIKFKDQTKKIQVENARIKSDLCPSLSTQFDLNRCLQTNLLSNVAYMDIVVSCSDLGSAKISLVYKVQGKIFLVGEASTNVYTTLKIQNSYFDNLESTLYASWALKSIGKDVNSIIWLRRFYTPSSESSALMYLITEDEAYITDLLEKQDENSGSFGTVYETALATLALRKNNLHSIEAEFAKSWLESKMLDDGSWNKDIKDTAMAIYGAFAPIDIDLTPLIQLPEQEAEPKECNENGLCEPFLQETALYCEDCFCGDTICDDSEDDISCLEDCEGYELGDYEPSDYEPGEYEPGDYEPSDYEPGIYDEDYYEEEEGRGFLFYFLIILIILAILGGLAYFYYKKFYLTGKQVFKKTPPLFKPPARRQPAYRAPAYQPRSKPRKSVVEQQLEKSLQEARKLLGKK